MSYRERRGRYRSRSRSFDRRDRRNSRDRYRDSRRDRSYERDRRRTPPRRLTRAEETRKKEEERVRSERARERDRARFKNVPIAKENVDMPDVPADKLKVIAKEIKNSLGYSPMSPVGQQLAATLRDYIDNMIRNNTAKTDRITVHVVGSWMTNSTHPDNFIDFEVTSQRGIDVQVVSKMLLSDTFKDISIVRGRDHSWVEKSSCDKLSQRMIDTMKFKLTCGVKRMKSTNIVFLYVQSSPVVVGELLRGLKEWSVRTGVDKVLSSYTLTVMVLYFLLMKDIVLFQDPSQILESGQAIIRSPVDHFFPQPTASDRTSVQMLFPLFFKFYSTEFDYEKNVISMNNNIIKRDEPKYANNKDSMYIECLVSPGTNLAASLTETNFSDVIDLIYNTHEALKATEEPAV